MRPNPLIATLTLASVVVLTATAFTVLPRFKQATLPHMLDW